MHFPDVLWLAESLNRDAGEAYYDVSFPGVACNSERVTTVLLNTPSVWTHYIVACCDFYIRHSV